MSLHRSNHYDFSFAWSAVPAGAVSLALSDMLGLPYYVWVSGPDIPGFEKRYDRLYPIITPLLRRIWKKARRVIAKCREEVEMIRAVDGTFPVEIIENGVDLEHFTPINTSAQDGPLRVVCSARLIERKGQRHLIQAVHRLVQEGLDVRLELVGDGDAMHEYRQLASSLGLNGQVEFSGYVARECIQEHLQRAHVFALPSYNEGMALAALEAMGCGLPVVLTRTGGTGALVQEGVNGFSHAWGDVEALAGCLRRFAQDRSLVASMGAASRQLASAYGWEALAERYLELFQVG
jgi:phosphatidylinositol alpha-1,6-mannosyltransferase